MKSNIIVYILTFVLLNSCAKDKGNYDLTAINEIEIKELSEDENIDVLLGEKLLIKTSISQKDGDFSQYGYRWYMFSDSQAPFIELSDKKDLDVPLNAPIGGYTLMYVVEDKRTGITATREQHITLVSKYGSGIVVLEETSKGGDISHIGFDGRIYKNLFSGANNGEYISVLQSDLKGFYYSVGKQFQKPIYIFLTSKGENTVELDPESYKKMENFSNMLATPSSEVTELDDIIGQPSSIATYSIVNGVVIMGSSGGKDPYLEGELQGDYRLAPFVITTTAGGNYIPNQTYFIGYDEKNGRFVWYSGFYSGHIKTYGTDISTPGAFDPNNIHKKCVYAGYSNDATLYNWIMKGPDNKMYFYQLYPVSTQNAARAYAEIPASANMSDARYFASSTSLPHIYYVVDNKVMLYDYISNTSRVVYNAVGGEDITDLKLSVSRVPQYQTGYRAIRTTGKLYLATYGNNKGRVLEFDIAATGGLDQPVKAYEGFGKIKSMFYKEKM